VSDALEQYFHRITSMCGCTAERGISAGQ
jgi:hypothetical protein